MPHPADELDPYIRPSISNGVPREQALIRRWWLEEHQGRGRLIWEYYLGGHYADAIWLPDSPLAEKTAARTPSGRVPIAGERVILCEAKSALTPELIGQALVYSRLAVRAGATLIQTIVFAETASAPLKDVAEDLGLSVVAVSVSPE